MLLDTVGAPMWSWAWSLCVSLHWRAHSTSCSSVLVNCGAPRHWAPWHVTMLCIASVYSTSPFIFLCVLILGTFYCSQHVAALRLLPIQTVICLVILHSFPTYPRSSVEFGTNILSWTPLPWLMARVWRLGCHHSSRSSTSTFVLYYAAYHHPFPFIRHSVYSFLVLWLFLISLCKPFFYDFHFALVWLLMRYVSDHKASTGENQHFFRSLPQSFSYPTFKSNGLIKNHTENPHG